MKIPAHWAFTFHRDPYEGENLHIADYTVQTDVDCIEKDLATGKGGLLFRYFHYSAVDPREYAKEHPVAVQALLAGLAANRDCFLRFGGWLTVVPPLGRAFTPESDLGVEAASGPGYRLWFRQQPKSEQHKASG